MSAQSLEALALANQSRYARAALRAWVKEPADAIVSRHRLADIIGDPDGLPDCLRTLMLEDFLLWGYRMYPRHRRGCYELADTHAGRLLGALTVRQRSVIADGLRMPAVQLEEEAHMHAWQRRQNQRAAA